MAKREDLKGLTAVSNNAGAGEDGGLAPLVRNGQVNKMILSFLGSNKVLEKLYLSAWRHSFVGLHNADALLQLAKYRSSFAVSPESTVAPAEADSPIAAQGTLAERIRCAGSGIPAFYTPTGVGTFVQSGEIPVRFGPKDAQGNLSVLVSGTPRETRLFDGKVYNMEKALRGDVAVIRAHKVDKAGNCIFRYTTKAFGPLMAQAAPLTIVEAEEIVEIGELHPDAIDLPGIFVDRIVPATVPKKLEVVKTAEGQAAAANGEGSKELPPALVRRNRIAKRAAKELTDGSYINLGVGMPTLAPSYLDPSTQVWIQSENGLLGMGPYPKKDEVDPDLINAGKETGASRPCLCS